MISNRLVQFLCWLLLWMMKDVDVYVHNVGDFHLLWLIYWKSINFERSMIRKNYCRSIEWFQIDWFYFYVDCCSEWWRMLMLIFTLLVTFTYYDWFIGNQSILSEVWYEKISVDQFGDSKSIGFIFKLVGFANLIIS